MWLDQYTQKSKGDLFRMIRYTPEFILEKYASGQMSGTLRGFVLLLDLIDFTQIVEKMQMSGLHGVDYVARLLDDILQAPIKSICKHGGFVNLFIGDAICCIFETEDPLPMQNAISEIRSHLAALPPLKVNASTISPAMRETIAFGDIEWGIINTEFQSEYLFFGDPMIELSILSKKKLNHAITLASLEQIGLFSAFPRAGKCPHQESFSLQLPESLLEIKARFNQTQHRRILVDNEVRPIVAVFVNIHNARHKKRCIKNLNRLARDNEGYINKIDYTDKGAMAVLIFGAPKSSGLSISQACEFSLSFLESDVDMAIGISSGYSYVGKVGIGQISEYTALGRTMNLASSLATRAQAGEILCDYDTFKEAQGEYIIRPQHSTQMASSDLSTKRYILEGRKKKHELFFSSPFVGREKELNGIKTLFENGRLTLDNHIVYIHGYAGQGKSRLAWEFYDKMQGVNKIFLAGYRETHFGLFGLRQLVDSYFKIGDSLTNAEALASYEQSLAKLNWPNPEELVLKEALAGLLDISYPESKFEKERSPERESLQKRAFSGFLAALIKDREVLVFFDDIQWLDKDLADYLRSIHIEQTHGTFIIATSRYLDQGQAFDLRLEDFIKHEIHLEGLDERQSTLLLENIINKEVKQEPFLQDIIRKSDGNPLLLEQLGFGYLERGFAQRGVNSQLNQTNFNISDAINSRIDSLGKSLQKCLYCAAILGNNFNINLLAGMMEKRLDEELNQGVQLMLWKKLREDIYSFGHIVIRDVVYERMLAKQAQDLHKTAASVISSFYGGDLSAHMDEIAYHHEKGGNLSQAQEDYHKAALYHRNKNNWYKALFYQRKSTLIAGRYHGFGSPQHIERLFWLGIFYHFAQFYDTAEPIYNMIYKAHARFAGRDETMLSDIINNLGRLYKDMGRFEEAEKLLRRSLRLEAKRSPGSSDVADRLNTLCLLFLDRGEPKKALAYGKLAYRYFTSWPHVHYVEYHALIRHNLAMVYIQLGNLDLAEEMLLISMSDFKRVHSKSHPRFLSCIVRLGDICFLKKDYEDALKCYQAAHQGYVLYFNHDFRIAKIQEENIEKVRNAMKSL